MSSPQGTDLTPVDDRGLGNGRITPLFALVFCAALGLTILSGVGMLILSLSSKDTDSVKSAIGTCSDMFKMGVAAVLGLIGGKATS